jgi:hypothetical protein
MSPLSPTKEVEFAFQIRRALDERAAELPPATAERLAAARQAALARRKPEAEPSIVLVPTLAGAGGIMLNPAPLAAPAPRREPLWRMLARAWPLVVIVAGLIGVTYWEDLQHTADLADIDAAMLSDDLPLNAYLDHGFNAYLSHDAR